MNKEDTDYLFKAIVIFFLVFIIGLLLLAESRLQLTFKQLYQIQKSIDEHGK